jgi:uncharacterized protein YjeT (DUF2065 family)
VAVSTLFLGIGVALVIEGLLYAAFPASMRAMMQRALTVPATALRTFGLIALAAGVLVVWLATG